MNWREDKKVNWCEHIEMRKIKIMGNSPDHWVDDCWTLSYDVVPSSWVVCPICGAPRPKGSSLRKRVAEALVEKSNADEIPFNKMSNDEKDYWLSLADVAIKVINGEK